MLQCGLRKRRGALGVVLGTSQYIVGRDQACGQFVQYLEKPAILNMRRLDLGVEVGLCGVVNHC